MFLSLLHVNVSNDPGRKWLRDVYRVHQRLWMAFPDTARRVEDPFFLGAWHGPPIAEPKPNRRDVGFLFRIERDGSPRILVQSVHRPDWDYAFQNAPYLLDADRKPQVREFQPALQLDQVYRFRLLANVVTRSSIPDARGRKGTKRPDLPRKRRTEQLVRPDPVPDSLPVDPVERKRVLVTRWRPWREWLQRIGAKRGFSVLDEPGAPLFMEAVSVYVRNHSASNQDKPMNRSFNGGLFEGVLVCAVADRLSEAILTGIGPGKAFGFGLLSLAPVR